MSVVSLIRLLVGLLLCFDLWFCGLFVCYWCFYLCIYLFCMRGLLQLICLGVWLVVDLYVWGLFMGLRFNCFALVWIANACFESVLRVLVGFCYVWIVCLLLYGLCVFLICVYA